MVYETQPKPLKRYFEQVATDATGSLPKCRLITNPLGGPMNGPHANPCAKGTATKMMPSQVCTNNSLKLC